MVPLRQASGYRAGEGCAERGGVMSLDTLECPCCGDVGAEEEVFTDGQELCCGCPGQVSCDSETEPTIVIYDEECPKCDEKAGG